MKPLNLFIYLVLCISSASALDWEKEIIDRQGSKPAIVLDSSNNPIIAFMLESFSGFVKLARNENGVWTTDTVSEGYFYGPLDVTVDENNTPFINYHDHTTEDQTVAALNNGEWDITPISHPGHDGWDNNICFSNDGTLHTLTTDPSGFGGEGLEFASFINGSWQVELVGTGPIMYAEGISIAFDSQNRPHISYHNSREHQLYHGVRDSILWSVSAADETPDTGMFSSIAISPSDEPMISYIAFNSDGNADIRLAKKIDGIWESEVVDTLDHLTTGFLLARNATSLVLDPSGNPAIAYTDENQIKFAQKIDGQWQLETIDTLENIDGMRFGQQVDLKRGSDGSLHLVSFDITNNNPLYGNIFYYKAIDTTQVKDWQKK